MSRRPNFGGMGMGNMQGLIKQAKKMQQQMEAEQANLATQEFSGDRQLKDLKIDKEAIDPDDPDMLQDLVIDAVNKGIKAVDDATQASMGKYTKGLM